ncbi:nSTAND1 domain-containing NTPase [Tolypothrix sp. VBCCA 56010]|uniref:nSTAND1 domain-containing NTPase n=1 Tax=Tolypothrix sp. VBCCA 56010 TaxID=3137731 RepID=UPI003D7E408F
MKKLVILQFDGEFSTGYKVTLEVGEEGKRPDLRIRGELPQAIDIIQCFQNWRDTYRSLYGQTRVKKIGARNVNINVLKQKCNERSQNLLNSFNSWLQSQSFESIINCLYQQRRGREDEIRVLLSTDCQELRKLPWHLWNGFYAIPYFRITPFEVALSAPDAERKERPFREKIRILIILGDSTGINVKADEQLLQQYCGDAEIVTLVEPLRQELNNYLQDEIGWDILFFSGHSHTQGTQGRIFLNHDDSLTMAELRDTLLPAIAKRLQLAIFNSCDGLGIARELESLQIPQVIVMREPVPDKVAQEFLKYFLKSFTGGRSLCISVGYARRQLEMLESQFPCASWLPVIIQNQLEMPPTWQSLGITRSPYRGLMAFREEDAENFFGREAFVEQLVIDVNRKPLVAVIGASGSGKSSVVFAGLIPQLRQNNIVGDNGCSPNWEIIFFRPGKNPFESLAIALEESRGATAEFISSSDAQILRRRQELELEIDLKHDICALQKTIEDILHTPSPTHLLLIVDQFEEIYTLCPDAQERQIFIDGLLKAVNDTPRFTLLITLRADFLGKAMSYQPLGKALQDYPPSLLAPMNREELERAITQPAARFSVELEEGLVNKLIDDVGSGEGSLPLQQFALTQLWAKQRPGLLTHQAYKEIGGVTQALANHAETVYASLSESEQKRAQRVFIQLVQPGEGTEDTRKLATSEEVGGDNWDLVTLLANERLLVTNSNELTGDTVEVVHEVLIRNWGRLRGWMDDNREFRTWQERLKVALQQWETNVWEEEGLLRGVPLVEAEIWLQKRRLEISFADQQFIEKSLILHEKKKKQNKRLFRGIISGFLGGLISTLSLVLSVIWYQNYETNAQLKNAILSAEKLLLSGNQSEALLQAVKAGKKFQKSSGIQPKITMRLISTLSRTLAFHESIMGKLYSPLISFNISPDGNTLALAYDDGTIKVWSKDGKQLHNFKADKAYGDIRQVNFSPDGNIIASVDPWGIRFWSKDGRELQRLKRKEDYSGEREFWSVSFSPDGNIIASVSKGIELWSKDGKKLRTLEDSESIFSDNVNFSPDNNTIASVGFSEITLWSKDGKKLRTLKDNDSVYHPVMSFSPDGKAIISGSDKGTITLWSKDGKQMQIRQGHDYKVIKLGFSYDGKTIISADEKGRIIIWDKNLKKLRSFRIESNTFLSDSSIQFSPDGNIIAHVDNKIKLFSHDGRELRSFENDFKLITINVSSNGKIFSSVKGNDKIVILYYELDELLAKACNNLDFYLKYNDVKPEDKHLCDDILDK